MSKNLGPDSKFLSKLAQFEKEKQERREMRRKAAKKKAKQKQDLRKQRHIAKRLPQPVTILGAGGGDAERFNRETGQYETIVELQFQALRNPAYDGPMGIFEGYGEAEAIRSLGVPKHILEGGVSGTITEYPNSK